MGTGLEEIGISDDAEDSGTSVVDVPHEPPESKSEPPESRSDLPRVGAPTPEVGHEERLVTFVRALESMALFDGLLAVHMRRIAKLIEEIRLKKGDFVFHHGDTGDGLYLILDGQIRISRTISGMGEEALAILKPGMYFGEMSIVDDEMPRSADAIVHERARLLKLPKDHLRDLMFVDRELAYELLWRFVRTLSTRLRDSNDRLMMLTVSSKF